MKKLSSLLTKVKNFEKLAVYGDRSVFLRSLAQEALDVSGLLDDFTSAVQGWVAAFGAFSKIPASAQRSVTFLENVSSSDPDKLSEIHSAAQACISSTGLSGAAKAAWDRQVAPIAQSLAQTVSSMGSVVDESYRGEKPTETSRSTPVSSGQSFPKELQRKLNEVLVDPENGLKLLTYLSEDGRLGPETRKHLEFFRAALTALPAKAPLFQIVDVLKNYIPSPGKPTPVDIARAKTAVSSLNFEDAATSAALDPRTPTAVNVNNNKLVNPRGV